MFLYILLALLALSTLIAGIISIIKKDPFIFLIVISLCLAMGVFVSLIFSSFKPFIEDTKFTETLQLLPLSDETPDKYVLVDNNTKMLTFKAKITCANGITTEKIYQEPLYFVYTDTEPDVEYEMPSVDIYEPITTFAYPAELNIDIHGNSTDSFYVLNLPSTDSILYKELKVNDFSTLNLQ